MGKLVNETAEADLQYGLIVIIWARWSIVIFAFILSLYRAEEMFTLMLTIVGLLAVALINFVLHTRILSKQPVEIKWVYSASIVDICLISLITGLEGGLYTNVFLYYYPAVLGFALVFPGAVTILLTIAVITLYSGICLLASTPSIQFNGDESIFIFRLAALLGIVIVGNRYRSVERQRMVKENDTRQTLDDELKRRRETPIKTEVGGPSL
jgi:signal transduction histidine kinase